MEYVGIESIPIRVLRVCNCECGYDLTGTVTERNESELTVKWDSPNPTRSKSQCKLRLGAPGYKFVKELMFKDERKPGGGCVAVMKEYGLDSVSDFYEAQYVAGPHDRVDKYLGDYAITVTNQACYY